MGLPKYKILIHLGGGDEDYDKKIYNFYISINADNPNHFGNIILNKNNK